MSRRFLVTLAAVCALGLTVRLAYVFALGPRIDLGFDALWYQLQAGTIAGGHGYVDPDAFYRLGRAEPTANFPPLWPLVLALVERLGPSGERAFQVVGAVLGTVTIGLTGLLGRRLVGGRVGIVAAGIVACSPMLIAADGSLMAESLYVALVTGAVLAAYAAIGEPSADRFALLGALLGLSALARSDGLILVPILAAATAWSVTRVSPPRRLGLAGCTVGVAFALVLPWTVRNSLSLGEPVLGSTNAGSVIEGANCPSTYAGELLGAWDQSCLVETRRAGTSESDWAAAARDAGVEYAREHPARLPLVGAVRVLRTWGLWDPSGQTALETIESRHEGWQRVGWAYDFVLLGVAVPGTVLLRRRGVPLGPLVGVVVAVCVVALVSNGNQRFRTPAAPALSVASATAFLAGADRVRSRA